MTEQWTHQLSIKAGQHMVNVRGNSAEELNTNIAGLNAATIAACIHDLELSVTGAQNVVAGLAIQPAGNNVAPAQAVVAGGPFPSEPAAAGGPLCQNHQQPMKLETKQSKSTGKPYSAYFCQAPYDRSAPKCPIQFPN